MTTEYPPPPVTIEQLGLPNALLVDVALRRTMFDGDTTTLALAESLAVNPSVMAAIVEELRRLRYLEVLGLDGRNYRLALTDLGYQHAVERMALCRYAGALPVNLAEYSTMVRAQQARPSITRTRLREALADLVVSDELLDELGPAVRSTGAMFLYGPAGTGKSSLAARLVRVYTDTVLIPHAVEVEGQIITLYDPVIHHAVEPQPAHIDQRWVLCARPSVIAGGELTMAALDLAHDAATGTYLAPLQMRANNGVLVIDDLGRQQVTPAQLLNRWLVPLDRSIDYLTLSLGVEFEIPCLEKIVFCTNLAPASLADEAFYRRLRGKVRVGGISDADFDEILRRAARSHGVAVDAGAADHLRMVSRERGDGDLRPYLPDAICEMVAAIAEYEERAAVLDRAMVDRASALYFTHDRSMRGDGRPDGRDDAPGGDPPALVSLSN